MTYVTTYEEEVLVLSQPYRYKGFKCTLYKKEQGNSQTSISKSSIFPTTSSNDSHSYFYLKFPIYNIF